MDDVKLKVSDKGLLKEALAKLHIPEDKTKPVRDNYGIIGYEISAHVLVAKPMFYKGTILSCHNDIIYRAMVTSKKILFYISYYNSFYEFEPGEVSFSGHRNRRGNATMVNFFVSQGQKVSIYCLMEKQKTLF